MPDFDLPSSPFSDIPFCRLQDPGFVRGFGRIENVEPESARRSRRCSQVNQITFRARKMGKDAASIENR